MQAPPLANAPCHFSTRPIWADGYVDGKRTLRKSLDTSDMSRARKKAANLEEDGKVAKPLPEAVGAFLRRCEGDGLSDGTLRKYRNSLDRLVAFCEEQGIDLVAEISVEVLDGFRFAPHDLIWVCGF